MQAYKEDYYIDRKKLKATEKTNCCEVYTFQKKKYFGQTRQAAVYKYEYFDEPSLIVENMRHLPVYFDLTVKFFLWKRASRQEQDA